MKIASVADVKARLSAYLKASEEAPVIVTRNGKPVAVLLGLEDEEEIERLVLAYSSRLRPILEAARQQIQEGRGVPHDEFWEQAEQEPSKPARKKLRRK